MITLARLTALTLTAALLVGCTNRHKSRATTRPTTGPATTQAATAPTINRFDAEVQTYLRADAASAPAENGIVFVGSSSIRGWRTLKTDFPDLNVIGRGFGGTQIIDSVRYAEPLVIKHRPKIVVFYAGENDLSARPPVSPQGVLRHFQTFVDVVHRELPETKIIFISCKPSPSREALLPQFRLTNALIEAYVATDARLSYVDVFTPMLDAEGKPRGELFLSDRLHMNREGYVLWTPLVRKAIDQASAPAAVQP